MITFSESLIQIFLSFSVEDTKHSDPLLIEIFASIFHQKAVNISAVLKYLTKVLSMDSGPMESLLSSTIKALHFDNSRTTVKHRTSRF